MCPMADSTGRFGVVRYPTYWVVIDKSTDRHDIVFESRSRDAAHKAADKRNKEWRAAQYRTPQEIEENIEDNAARKGEDLLDAPADWDEDE